MTVKGDIPALIASAFGLGLGNEKVVSLSKQIADTIRSPDMVSYLDHKSIDDVYHVLDVIAETIYWGQDKISNETPSFDVWAKDKYCFSNCGSLWPQIICAALGEYVTEMVSKA